MNFRFLIFTVLFSLSSIQAANLTQKIFEAKAEYSDIQNKLRNRLYEAVKKGNYEEVKATLEAGADPNYETFAYYPISLIAADTYHNLPIVKLLIWYGYTKDNINRIIAMEFMGFDSSILRFIKNYAPKIERIKRENMLKKINNFLKQQVELSMGLPNVITNLTLEYIDLYTENLSELAKISDQEIDEIINIYDKNINIKTSNSECLIM